jgi:hypothetical protein
MKSLPITIILLLSCCASLVHAQEKFTGIIEYKTISYGKDNKPVGPNKLSIIYGTDKAILRMEGLKDDDNGWILLNALTDSVYMMDTETHTYERENLLDAQENTPFFKKTDSIKTFFGYPCRGYKVEDEKNVWLGYIWVAENLTWLSTNKTYKHPAFWMVGGNHLLLSLEMYEKGSRVGAYFPVSVTKMEPLPDSLLDYSGYKEKGKQSMFDEIMTDSVIKKLLPDTTLSAADMNRLRMTLDSAIKDPKTLRQLLELSKKIKATEKRKTKSKLKTKKKTAAIMPKAYRDMILPAIAKKEETFNSRQTFRLTR